MAIAISAATSFEGVKGHPRRPFNSQRIAMSTATPERPTAANFANRGGNSASRRRTRWRTYSTYTLAVTLLWPAVRSRKT